jgi:anaphase-promoting complex subunit 7
MTYESGKIIDYLLQKYAAEPPPAVPAQQGGLQRRCPAEIYGTVRLLTSGLASHLRGMAHMGLVRTPSRPAAQPLELASYEGHPGARLVREALCTLELHYVVRTTPLGAVRRRSEGCRRPPWLHDPNTGYETDCCSAACDYLYDTYATGEPQHGTDEVPWAAFTRRRIDAMRGLVRSLYARVGPLSV